VDGAFSGDGVELGPNVRLLQPQRRAHRTATQAGASSSPRASDGHAGVHAEPLDPINAELSIFVVYNNLDLFWPDLRAGSKKTDWEDAYTRKDPAGQHACINAWEAIRATPTARLFLF
jgi:hypothetical protein